MEKMSQDKREDREIVLPNYFEVDPKDRTRRYFGEENMRILQQSKVLLVGAGAIGNEVAKNLGMLGIGTIIIVDYDKVTNSNLNRCVFFRKVDHMKKFKTDAIAERLSEISESIIIPVSSRIENAPDFVWDVDLIIVGVDDNFVRYYINSKNLSLKIPKPIINGAMGRDFVHIDVLKPPKTACLVCTWSAEYKDYILSRKVKEKCDDFFVDTLPKFPMISFTTSIVGAIISLEATKVLLYMKNKNNKEDNTNSPLSKPAFGKSIVYNINTNRTSIIGIPKNPNCVEPLCRIKKEKEILNNFKQER